MAASLPILPAPDLRKHPGTINSQAHRRLDPRLRNCDHQARIPRMWTGAAAVAVVAPGLRVPLLLAPRGGRFLHDRPPA